MLTVSPITVCTVGLSLTVPGAELTPAAAATTHKVCGEVEHNISDGVGSLLCRDATKTFKSMDIMSHHFINIVGIELSTLLASVSL